ncbi:MAG: hypothetical protein Q9217_001785 [Psora testacea]
MACNSENAREQEKFRRRKLSILRKANEIANICDARVYLYIEHKRRCYVYKSCTTGLFPPADEELVGNDAHCATNPLNRNRKDGLEHFQVTNSTRILDRDEDILCEEAEIGENPNNRGFSDAKGASPEIVMGWGGSTAATEGCPPPERLLYGENWQAIHSISPTARLAIDPVMQGGDPRGDLRCQVVGSDGCVDPRSVMKV